MASLTATTGAWAPSISARIAALRANVAQGNTISVTHIDELQSLISDLWGHTHTVTNYVSKLEYGDGRNTQLATTSSTVAWSFDSSGNYTASVDDVTVNTFSVYTSLATPDSSTYGTKVAVFGYDTPFASYTRALTSASKINMVGALNMYYQVNKGTASGWGEEPDAGEDLVLQYSLDGSTWVELNRTTPASVSANTWTTKAFTIPTGAKDAAGVYLRFYQAGAADLVAIRDTWAVTPVVTTALASSYTASHLYNPAPTNGAYVSWLNTYGVWEGNGNYFWVAYFPATAEYDFYGAIDNYGDIYLDGTRILSIPNYAQHFVRKTVTIGYHTIRMYGVNTGGPASLGGFVRRVSNSAIIWTSRNKVDPDNTGLLIPTANASGTISTSITTSNVLVAGSQTGQKLTLEYAVPGTYTLAIPAGATVEALVIGAGGGGGGGDNRRSTFATGGGGGGGGYYGIAQGTGTRPIDMPTTTITRTLQFGIWYDPLVYGFNNADWSENMLAYAVWPRSVVQPTTSYESYRMFQAPYTGVYYIAGAADQTLSVIINGVTYSTASGAFKTRTASGLTYTAVTMNAGGNVIQFDSSNGNDATGGFFVLIYDSTGKNGRPGTGNGTNARANLIWQPKDFLTPSSADGSNDGWRAVTNSGWSTWMNTYAVWPSTNYTEVKTYNFKRTITFPYTGSYSFEFEVDDSIHCDLWDTGSWNAHIFSGSGNFRNQTPSKSTHSLRAGPHTFNFTVRNGGGPGGFGVVIRTSLGEVIWDTRTQGILPEAVEVDTITTADTLTIQVGTGGTGAAVRGSGTDGSASYVRIGSTNRYYYGFGGKGGASAGVPGDGGRAPVNVTVGQPTYAGTTITYEIGTPGAGGVGGGTGGGTGASSSSAANAGTAFTGAGGGGGWSVVSRSAGGTGASGGIYVEQTTGDLYGPGGGGGGAGADGTQLGMVANYVTASLVGSTYTWFDTVGSSQNATIVGGSAATIPSVGIRGVKFAGTAGSYAQIPDSADIRLNSVANNSFTVEAWVYRQGGGSNTTYGGMIVNKDYEYEIAIRNDGTVTFAWTYSNGSWYWIDDTANIGTRYTTPLPIVPLNTPTHVAWVMEGSNAYLYINGVFKWANSVALPRGVYTGTRYPLYFGGRHGKNQQLNGIIANVKLWNVARTAQQILEGVRGSSISGASVYFDGTEDSVRIPDLSGGEDFDFGSDPFFIEFYMRRNAVQPKGAYSGIINKRNTDGQYAGFWIGLTNSIISAYVTNNSSTWGISIAGGGTIAADRWYHVGFGRVNDTFRLFLDGAVVASGTMAGAIPNNTFPLNIGNSGITGAYPYVGYLSNLRVTRGSGLYTGTFVVPTRPLESTSQTKLLTFQDTDIVDNSKPLLADRKTLTVVGNPTVQALSPLTNGYSGASAYFDGNGDYFTIANEAGFNFGTGSFTVEVWINTVYKPSSGDYDSIVSKYASGSWWGIQTNSQGHVVAGTNPSDGNYMIGTTTDVCDGAWHHIALVRSGSSSLSLYIDGALETTLTNSTNADNTATVEIGRIGAFGTGRYFNGYMSNLRVVKGYAMYSAPFTPSSVPLASRIGCSLLTFQDSTIKDVGPLSVTVTAQGTARARAYSPFGNTYNTPSFYFDGSGDNISPPVGSKNAWKFLHDGTTDWTAECFFYNGKTAPLSQGTFLYTTGSGNEHGIWFGLNDSNSNPGGTATASVQVYFMAGGAYKVYSTQDNAWAPNRWNHVAAVFTSATKTMVIYVNGVPATMRSNAYGGFTNSSYSSSNPTNNLLIGSGYTGYISNLRIVKDVLYTEQFAVPTEPLTAISGTALLTGIDTTIQDRSTNNYTLTAAGNTRLEDFSPFGVTTAFAGTNTNYSGFFDGDGDYLRIGTTTASPSGTNAPLVLPADFTIEFWMFQPTIPTTPRVIFELGDHTLGEGIILNAFNTSPNGNLYVNGTLRASNFGDYLYANTWQHVAFSRSGSQLKVYVDGVMIYNITESASINTNGRRLHIGASVGAYDAAKCFLGFISNFRIVKGSALYTGSSFQVPTGVLSAISGTSLLTLQDTSFKDNGPFELMTTSTNYAYAGNVYVTANSPFVSSGGAAGGNGGLFGGGGAGGANTGTGLGAQGAIIINYQATGVAKTVILANTAQTSYTLPSDFLYFNYVDAIGAGGSGGVAVTTSAAFGGGGGAFSRSTTISGVAASDTVFISVGLGGRRTGGDSWINTVANAAPSSATTGVLAKGGVAGSIGSAGNGGAAASGVGNTRYSGGKGGLSSSGRGFGGGGGAAGPLGDGAAGGNSYDVASGKTGASGGGGGGANKGGKGGTGTAAVGGQGGGNAEGGAYGGNGGPTVVYYQGATLYAAGGTGGQYNTNSLASGGGAAGGDVNSAGGYGHGTSGDQGGGGGGAIGTGNAVHDGGNAGDNGAASRDVNGLFTIVAGLSQTTANTGGLGSASGSKTLNNRGGDARGFGGGGGGAGYWGGDGGRGLYGGGGGGAAGYGYNYSGGTGGWGAVVAYFIGAPTANASVILTSGNSYVVPSGTTSVKLWAIGAGGGGAGATTNDGTAGGGGGAGGISSSTFTGGPAGALLNVTSANGTPGTNDGFGSDSVYPDLADTRGRPGSVQASDGSEGIYGGGGAGGFASLASGIQETGTDGGDGYVKLVITNYAAPGVEMPNISVRNGFFTTDANILIRAAHVNNMYQNLVGWAGSTHVHDVTDTY